MDVAYVPALVGTSASIWLCESVKVVHFVSFAGQGGAGRAALRLHRQFLKSGWNSWMNSLEVSSPASEHITVTSQKFPAFFAVAWKRLLRSEFPGTKVIIGLQECLDGFQYDN